MDIKSVLAELKSRMNKSVEMVRSEFNSIRTGKASPTLVENITIDYYGTPTRVRDLAGISTPDPKLIVIQPWDPTVLPAIDKSAFFIKLNSSAKSGYA